jgi:hypothetical protein
VRRQLALERGQTPVAGTAPVGDGLVGRAGLASGDADEELGLPWRGRGRRVVVVVVRTAFAAGAAEELDAGRPVLGGDVGKPVGRGRWPR